MSSPFSEGFPGTTSQADALFNLARDWHQGLNSEDLLLDFVPTLEQAGEFSSLVGANAELSDLFDLSTEATTVDLFRNGVVMSALIEVAAGRVSDKLFKNRSELDAKVPHLNKYVLPAITADEIDNVARFIDHTILKPTTREADVLRICAEAREYGFKAVCVNGAYAKTAMEALAGSGVRVACVAGFPLGAMTIRSKAEEARGLCALGVDEIDYVVNIGKLLDWDLEYIHSEFIAMREGCSATAKIILECGALELEHIAAASIIAVLAGLDFVKTSTGFGYGGAIPCHVRLMKLCVGDMAEVKASGGVRNIDQAIRVIQCGATRIGASAGVQIVRGQTATSDY